MIQPTLNLTTKTPRHKVSLFFLCILASLWLLFFLSGCREEAETLAALADKMQQALTQVQTVEGRLKLQVEAVELEQELWVQRPHFLRTETESGPKTLQGTIVVLNEQEGWLYNPTLNLVTLMDRSALSAEQLAHETGAGSLLERLPDAVVALLQSQPPFNNLGAEVVANRQTRHLEIVITQSNDTFPAGPLQLWLDEEFGYPLAVQMSSGLQIRFSMVRFNRTIDPKTFLFVPPPGAVVQKVQPTQ